MSKPRIRIVTVATINITFGCSRNTPAATIAAMLALRAPCMYPIASLMPGSGHPSK